MKKTLIIFMTAAFLFSACGKNSGEKNAGDAPQVTVTTQKSEIRNFSVHSSYSGTVKPNSEINVTPKASGKVVADYTEIGKSVEAGEVLFEIESTDQRLQLDQAQASYNSAVANYERTVGGSAQQSIAQLEQALTAATNELNDSKAALDRAQASFDSRIDITQAKNALEQAQMAYDNALELFNSNASTAAAQANYDTAKLNFERTKELYNTGAVSKVTFENAENSYKSAEAQLHSAKIGAQQSVDSAKLALDSATQQYKNAEINLTTALDAAKTRYTNAQANYNSAKQNLALTKNVINPENAKSAKAQVASAQAALNIAKQAVNNTIVTAPVAGKISAENISLGEIASPAGTSVTIVDLNGVTIEISLSENTISNVQQGTPATVSVSSAGIDGIDGVIYAVSPSAYNGMFAAEIHVSNADGKLKGGMVADVMLATGIAENAVIIPAAAITTKNDESFVYINNGGKPEKITVTVGIANDDYAQILSGLSGGEDVVVKGKDFITEDCVLNVVEN